MECVENNISALRKLGFIANFENQNSSVSSVGSAWYRILSDILNFNSQLVLYIHFQFRSARWWNPKMYFALGL